VIARGIGVLVGLEPWPLVVGMVITRRVIGRLIGIPGVDVRRCGICVLSLIINHLDPILQILHRHRTSLSRLFVAILDGKMQIHELSLVENLVPGVVANAFGTLSLMPPIFVWSTPFVHGHSDTQFVLPGKYLGGARISAGLRRVMRPHRRDGTVGETRGFVERKPMVVGHRTMNAGCRPHGGVEIPGVVVEKRRKDPVPGIQPRRRDGRGFRL
jgi:hypothetical protein